MSNNYQIFQPRYIQIILLQFLIKCHRDVVLKYVNWLVILKTCVLLMSNAVLIRNIQIVSLYFFFYFVLLFEIMCIIHVKCLLGMSSTKCLIFSLNVLVTFWFRQLSKLLVTKVLHFFIVDFSIMNCLRRTSFMWFLLFTMSAAICISDYSIKC